ncbi:MAG: hypothetical protein H0V63_00470 [Burkholderiaceae bacterium]|nr:hypothetical protein [Burkholderiaceae bacterium]
MDGKYSDRSKIAVKQNGIRRRRQGEAGKSFQPANTLLRRLMEAGWITQTAIKPGELYIEFNDTGQRKINIIHSLLTELSAKGRLSPEELVALTVFAARYAEKSS